MTNMESQILSDINKFKQCVSESNGTGEICRKYNFCDNGKSRNFIKCKINDLQLDTSHFGLRNHIRKYDIIEKECPLCGIKFNTLKNHPREKITCSRLCSNKYNAKPLDVTRKEKIGNSLKKYYSKFIGCDTNINKKQNILDNKTCNVCKVEFKPRSIKTIYCSNLCRCNSIEYREKLRQAQLKRVANGTHTGWKSRANPSYAELFFMKVLTNNNIKYEFEKPCGKYFIDFAISDKMIALEIDGKQHQLESRKLKDIEKDEFLRTHGWTVYRIQWKSINTESGKLYIESEINKFIEFLDTNSKQL